MTAGAAFTVIEKVVLVPVQLFEKGVTVIKPEIAKLLGLVAEKARIFPDPETGNPIAALVLVH